MSRASIHFAVAVTAASLAFGLARLRHAPPLSHAVGAAPTASQLPATPATTAADRGPADAQGTPTDRRDGGYTFTSALSLEEMHARLDAAGPFRWSARESDWYGDYLGTQTLKEAAVLKVVALPSGGFGLDLKLRTDAGSGDAQWAWLEETVSSTVLPTVQAREIRRSGPID